ncbi:MAG: RluA family pseudouridine synthase [Rubrivivax sp.]
MHYRERPEPDDRAERPDDESADPVESHETRRLTLDARVHGARLDKVLVGVAPEFSRTYLQSLIARGHVRLDGVPSALAARRVRAGQALELDLVPTEQSLAFRPQPLTLVVLYEDDSMLIIDKPVGLVVHPAPGNWSGTLLNGLLHRYPAAATLPRAGIVHRLDKDTSGAMVIGKTLPAVTALSRAIAERRAQRRYVAIAHGTVLAPVQTLDAPIGRDPVSRVRMAIVGGGRGARTDVRRLAVGAGCSALACTLHTGRTHQIRVHLAHAGHPLVADTLYGGRPALGLARQALHAARLALPHPEDGRTITVDCAPPADFLAAWLRVGAAPAWPEPTASAGTALQSANSVRKV